jgi:hypothetical protein
VEHTLRYLPVGILVTIGSTGSYPPASGLVNRFPSPKSLTNIQLFRKDLELMTMLDNVFKR